MRLHQLFDVVPLLRGPRGQVEWGPGDSLAAGGPADLDREGMTVARWWKALKRKGIFTTIEDAFNGLVWLMKGASRRHFFLFLFF